MIMNKFNGNVLYKYLKKEHSEKLLRFGQFRIGTLFEYKNTEKYGEVIGDKQEEIGRAHV